MGTEGLPQYTTSCSALANLRSEHLIDDLKAPAIHYDMWKNKPERKKSDLFTKVHDMIQSSIRRTLTLKEKAVTNAMDRNRYQTTRIALHRVNYDRRKSVSSPESKLIASSYTHGSVDLQKTETGAHLFQLNGRDGAAPTIGTLSISFSLSSKLLVTSFQIEAAIRVWDTDTGACVKVLRVSPLFVLQMNIPFRLPLALPKCNLRMEDIIKSKNSL
jgi:WD40 repeat protein